ncbi:hypothetical protein GCM10027614_74820 [Micromonospora vulcania]
MTPSRRRLLLAAATTLTSPPRRRRGVRRPATGRPEQIDNGDFSAGVAPWFSYGTGALAVTDGQLCTTVPGGLANPWDAGIGQDGVPLLAGAEYTLGFAVSATPGTAIKAVLQLGSAPYTTYAAVDAAATGTPQRVEQTFTVPDDNPGAQLIFQVGGAAAAQTVCLDDVSLRGGEPPAPYEPDTGPRVRVNQVGYLPGGPKNATVVTTATEPLPWHLRSGTGTVLATGTTTARGVDTASGQNVQTVDFSGYRMPGTGLTLTVDGATSHPFDISGTLYDRLRADSLQFFYAQRSGIAIDGDLIGDEYARPAGHLGVAPNQETPPCPASRGLRLHPGRTRRLVRRRRPRQVRGQRRHRHLPTAERLRADQDGGHRGRRCWPGRRDASGARARQRRTGHPRRGTLGVGVPAAHAGAGRPVPRRHGAPQDPRPELDRPAARPAGRPAAARAAPAVHRRHAQPGRHRRPVRAALRPYDATFAARCATAATTAYAAAKAHPTVYASPSDGTGGGAYDDGVVTDEFYWAAVELYLSTGAQTYLTDLTASPHHTGDVFGAQGFGWQSTAALGRLDLATVPNGLPAAELTRVRASVTTAADAYLTELRRQAYGLPLPGDPGSYVWGGNSNLINNAVVLATAFDLTRDAVYRDGAVQATDYLFGRNALNISYVTGWGEHAAQNQHSRIFANQLDASLPHPPAGSLAGGANAALQDPFAAQLLAGCAPMFCYVDDINSYATNEVAINWNSALAWIASFLADQGDAGAVPATTCTATYTNYGAWHGGTGFTAQVTVRNTGATAVNGWTVRFAFTGDQRVREAWLAKVTQTGATVTARNEQYNAKINPGATATFGFNATTAGGPNPNPTLVTLNGAPCTLS